MYCCEKCDDELHIVIDQIEKHKARVRIEADDLNESYHRGAWRSQGYTKSECERKLSRLNGEVVGLESALTYLYKLRDS